MAGADKKNHTRNFIENVSWEAHQAFIYGYLDDETIDEEIARYSKPGDWRYKDDLLPALLELLESRELKALLEFAEKSINRLPENARGEVELELKKAQESGE